MFTTTAAPTTTHQNCNIFSDNCAACVYQGCTFCTSIALCTDNATARCPPGTTRYNIGSSNIQCPLPTNQFRVTGIYIFCGVVFALSLLAMVVQVILRHPKFATTTMKAQRIVPVVSRFLSCLFAVVFTGIATTKANSAFNQQKESRGHSGFNPFDFATINVCGINDLNAQFLSSSVSYQMGIWVLLLNGAMTGYAILCFVGWFIEGLLILRGSKMAPLFTFGLLMLVLAAQPAVGMQAYIPLNSDPPCVIGNGINLAESLSLAQVVLTVLCMAVPLILLALEPVAPSWLRKLVPGFLRNIAPQPTIAAADHEGSEGSGMIKLPSHYNWKNFLLGGYFTMIVVAIGLGILFCIINFIVKAIDGSIWGLVHRQFFTSLLPCFDILFYYTGKLIHHILWVNIYSKGKFGIDASLVAEQEVLLSTQHEQNILLGDSKPANNNDENTPGSAVISMSSNYGDNEDNTKDADNVDNDNDDTDDESSTLPHDRDAFSSRRLSTAPPKSSVSYHRLHAAQEEEEIQQQQQQQSSSSASSQAILAPPSETADSADTATATAAAPSMSRFFISEMEEHQWEDAARQHNQRILSSDEHIYRPPSYFMAISCIILLGTAQLINNWGSTGNASFIGGVVPYESSTHDDGCTTHIHTYGAGIKGELSKSKCWQISAIGPLVICLWIFLFWFFITSILAYALRNKTGDIIHVVTLGIVAFLSIFLSCITVISPPEKCILLDYEGVDLQNHCSYTTPSWAMGPSAGAAVLLAMCCTYSFFFFAGQLADPIRVPKPVETPHELIEKYGFWTQFVEPKANRKNRVFFVNKPTFLVVQYHALVTSISRFIKTISQNWLTLLAFWTPIAAYDYHSMVIDQIELDGRKLELDIYMIDFVVVWFKEAFLNFVTFSLWSRYSNFSVERYYDSKIRFREPPHCNGLFRYFDVPTTQTLGQTFYSMGHVLQQTPSSVSEFSIRLQELWMTMAWFGDMQLRLVPGALKVLNTSHPIATKDPAGAHLDTQIQIFTREQCALCEVGEFECKCSCDTHTPLCRACFQEHRIKAIDKLRRDLRDVENTSCFFRIFNSSVNPRDYHVICPIIPTPEECESSAERQAMQKLVDTVKEALGEAAVNNLSDEALKRLNIDKETMARVKAEIEKEKKEKEEEEKRNRAKPLNEYEGDEKFRAQKRFELFYETHKVEGSATKCMSSAYSEEDFMSRLCTKHKVFEEDEIEAAFKAGLLPKDLEEKYKKEKQQEQEDEHANTDKNNNNNPSSSSTSSHHREKNDQQKEKPSATANDQETAVLPQKDEEKKEENVETSVAVAAAAPAPQPTSTVTANTNNQTSSASGDGEQSTKPEEDEKKEESNVSSDQLMKSSSAQQQQNDDEEARDDKK